MARAKATKSKPAEKKKSKAAAAAAGSKRAAKSAVSKARGKKPVAAKASTGKVASGRTAASKPKKAASGKTAPRVAKAGKAAKKAPTTKNVPVKKAPAKNAKAKKAPVKKAPAKKAPARAAAGKAEPKKAAPKSAVEKGSKKVAAKKSSAAAKTSGGESPKPRKKVGIEEVKAAAVRTSKKVSKRGRKRQRVTPTSTPLANWIPKDGLRPSSFLPAPPRAQSAFTVAAAPASSDRLVRDEDLTPPAPIRTIPVLVNVVQEDGRIELRTNPAVVEVAPGDAVEWDFRYFGGADVLVTQVAIEISKPSPFGKTSYKSAKPGSARPHRHVSDIVKDRALGSSSDYSIHCTNSFKTELAQGSASIVVREAEPTDAAH